MDDASPLQGRDADRARELRRIKLAATLLLISTAALFGVARHFEPMHWAWGYVAAFASAATVGGLADWYAVVALFRRPLGLPIPHTAIIPSNHERIADNLGNFIESNFLAPETVAKKLGEVDFAAHMATWLGDRERSAALSAFAVRMLPKALAAIDEGGLRRFLAERLQTELQKIEIAPLAAGLLGTITEKGQHRRLLDELLGVLEKFLTNEQALAALRNKIRQELPAVFKLYRADAYLLRKIVASAIAFLEEARKDPDHPVRAEFDRFAKSFVERLGTSRSFARRAEEMKSELMARPEVAALAGHAWDGLRSFLERDAGSGDSQVQRQLEAMLVDIGGQLARDPAIRAEINRGMVEVLGEFVQSQRSGVGRFIADQVKSWDIDVLIGRVELTVGRDLQYIRFNGTLIGGLAGLALHVLEQGLKLQL
ncbi:DUF445 domain-containing protein [Reyranella sp.]|uniref:DUF445 domain-containing protein n=1 Tax=Reyranella sp. TaxID=1929291 RepID=UPI003D0DAE2B